ncbi:MAG: EF2563 family selenium-dependent molybdenum hydroxylase system protein [Anaerolineaceae bacterium]|nr:EF2563 family selenium-dependent molybdenum hydroxylase system protein [Anaerolineaceae bacterium]
MNILIRGGGDLGSGVAFRLHRVGWNVVITEIEKPLVLRRTVSFANAIYEKESIVEGTISRYVSDSKVIPELIKKHEIPVLISPERYSFPEYNPDIVVDARLLKIFVEYLLSTKPMVIGLGPGFKVGKNCHAVIETNRGHYLGRALWEGAAISDTGIPGTVSQKSHERVLRAPASGTIQSNVVLGTLVKKGDLIGRINNEPILAPFDGCLRGLMHDGIYVEEGIKIGDLDPRLDNKLIYFISEKSLAIAGGVLEAILTYQNMIK